MKKLCALYQVISVKMCVRLFVGVHVYLVVCMCVFVGERVHMLALCVCVHMCVCVCVYVCSYMCAHACEHSNKQDFGVTIDKALQLNRHTEYCQWMQHAHDQCDTCSKTSTDSKGKKVRVYGCTCA